MQAAGERIAETTGHGPVFLAGLPDFKLADAIGYPIEHSGGEVFVLAENPGYPLQRMPTVVVCDRLFEGPIGIPCGGPAEDKLIAREHQARSGSASPPPVLVERFAASPRTWVSIYR